MSLLDSIGPWIWIAPCLVLGLLSLPYVMGPVLVWLFTRISARPTLEEFYLEDPSIPRRVLDYVDDTLEDVERDGFAVLGAFYLETLVANVRSFLVLIGKQQTQELALLAVTYAQGGVGVQLQQTHVEFSTCFAGDGSIDTNNSEELGAFLPVPGHVTYSFPWISNVRRLYRIHRAIVRRQRPDDERRWPVGDDPAAYLEGNLAEALARQVPVGCLRPASGGKYRLSVGSAFRITYQNLWPFKAIAKARRRSRGEKLLRELGI
jgi:hypothetical protein